MEVITIESEAYKNLIYKIDLLLNASKAMSPEIKEELLTNKNVCNILKISPKTLFNYRVNGLAYIKIRRKIFYKKEYIENFLQQNFNDSF